MERCLPCARVSVETKEAREGRCPSSGEGRDGCGASRSEAASLLPHRPQVVCSYSLPGRPGPCRDPVASRYLCVLSCQGAKNLCVLASASNVGEHILSLLQYFQVGPRIQELLDIVGSSWLPALSGVLPQPYFGCVLHLGLSWVACLPGSAFVQWGDGGSNSCRMS